MLFGGEKKKNKLSSGLVFLATQKRWESRVPPSVIIHSRIHPHMAFLIFSVDLHIHRNRAIFHLY